MNYKQKLFCYFVFIFLLFTVGIVLFEQSRERKFKTEALKEKLDAYTEIAHAALSNPENRQAALDSLMLLFPTNMRFTLVSNDGNVLYDNVLHEPLHIQNHSDRPEIQAAKAKGIGSDIRISLSNEVEYLYYAKYFHPYFVRVALPYDVQVQHFLQPDNFFLYYMIALFVVMLFLINYISLKFGKSIRQLRDFTYLMESGDFLVENGEWKMENGKNNPPLSPTLHSQFPKDELGEIGQKIAENYLQLKESKKKVALEREKLLQHVHSSEEGLCFFSAGRAVEFYNGLFIQYLNIISDEANGDLLSIFTDASFREVVDFLKETKKRYFETKISKQGRLFAVRVNIFDDNSFEIILNDITKQEKTRLLKQEMTGNITHELRTPVTGIRGYLETILENRLDVEKERYFLEKAYRQSLMLSELISDMSLLTKIEEVPQSFQLEAVNISLLIEALKNDLELPLQEKGIKIETHIPKSTLVNGNFNLLYSIFRNLTDNVIRYAGNDVTVFINQYNEDTDFYYFSYSDTGVGIPDEHHLNRLFERFYRIDEGRTRDTGGSGLGLSIVKNAVAFHKGTISVKNRVEGGLEFLFRLPKG